jgi:hypothetical protein
LYFSTPPRKKKKKKKKKKVCKTPSQPIKAGCGGSHLSSHFQTDLGVNAKLHWEKTYKQKGLWAWLKL